jgi:hypothetical protein
MERPSVKIIQSQQEEVKSVEVSGSEADYLLSKYGYSNSVTPPLSNTSKNNLTFEEMIKLQNEEDNRNLLDQQRRNNQPKPVSFNNRNVGYTETKYTDIEEGFGIKITIVSDMKI